MRYILTESQHKFLLEQNDADFLSRTNDLDATFKKAGGPKKLQNIVSWAEKHPHEVNTIGQLAAYFIPYVGPTISTGIGLYDAKLYYDEGDKKTAGLVAVFSFIPAVGGLATKLGLTKWTAKALGEIGKKLSLGQKLLPAEAKVASRVAQYKKLISAEIKKIGETATTKQGSQAVRKQLQKQAIKKNLKNTGKTIAAYGAAGVGYSKGYDYVQKDTPKTKSQSEGYDWNFVRSSFGSSGTEDENKLLTQAWDKGWRPGQVVPKQYQTKQYQTIYAQETENINTLQQLVAQAKTQ